MANDVTPEETLVRIGAKLRELRKRKGYTSAENFAYDFDLPRVHYWRIERGKANLTIKTLQKILSIHCVDICEFFANGEKDYQD